MMNDINKQQSEENQIILLAAQNELYSTAKTILSWQIMVSVIGMILFSMLVAIFPKLKTLNAFLGVLITFLDIYWLSPLQSYLKTTAARIQELFDCTVLEIPWNDLKVGARPDIDTIITYSQKYRLKNQGYDALKNKYPSVIDQLPISKARIQCQRINCVWDSRLHSLYCLYIKILLGISFGVIFLVGIYNGVRFDNLFLGILVPLMPAFVLGIRLIQEHSSTVSKMKNLKNHVDHIWQMMKENKFTDEQSRYEARTIQNEIYDQRAQGPLVFDWCYKLVGPQLEYQINKIAEEIVKQDIQSQ